jgi:y4mF family transcriptional regulator
MQIRDFIKMKRKQFGLTQDELASKAGVGLRLVREIEQGKQSMRLDKVEQILQLLGGKILVTEKMSHE